MLSQKEKELLAQVWNGLIPAAEDIGSDSLLRWVCDVKSNNQCVEISCIYRGNERLTGAVT